MQNHLKYNYVLNRQSIMIKMKISLRNSDQIAEMNLSLVLTCMVMLLFCGRCKAAPGLIASVHRNLENHPHIHR